MSNLQSRSNIRPRVAVELTCLIAGAVIVYLISSRFDLAEDLIELSFRYEHLELDELLSVLLYAIAVTAVIAVLRWRDAVAAVRREHQLNLELQQALGEIKELEGILPVCSFCKRIRDDDGNWQQMETYIRDRSSADFSHGICDECMKKHYPDHVD